jgi:hypothetical protein
MPGLEPGIHQTKKLPVRWIAGSFGPKTRFALLPGNDDKEHNAHQPKKLRLRRRRIRSLNSVGPCYLL